MTAKIFSVEDEESLVSLLEYNIKSSGYDFYHASTAYQGMIDIQKVKPDLILLDWMLPINLVQRFVNLLEVMKVYQKLLL